MLSGMNIFTKNVNEDIKIFMQRGLKFHFRKAFEISSNANGNSIDLGCGPFPMPFAKYTLDINEKVTPSVVGDVLTLPLKRESFDRVFFLAAFEHIPSGRELDVLEDIHRILKPGGELILVTHLNRYLFKFTDPAFYLRDHHYYSFEEMDGYIKKAGFKVESMTSVGGIWNMVSALWYYLLTYLFKIRLPVFLLRKADKNYDVISTKGWNLLVKAVKEE